MKLLTAFLCILATSAFAAGEANDATTPPCGKTVAECQKKSDADAAAIKQLTAAYMGARQQRDLAQQGLSDKQLEGFVAGQTAPPKK